MEKQGLSKTEAEHQGRKDGSTIYYHHPLPKFDSPAVSKTHRYSNPKPTTKTPHPPYHSFTIAMSKGNEYDHWKPQLLYDIILESLPPH